MSPAALDMSGSFKIVPSIYFQSRSQRNIEQQCTRGIGDHPQYPHIVQSGAISGFAGKNHVNHLASIERHFWILLNAMLLDSEYSLKGKSSPNILKIYHQNMITLCSSAHRKEIAVRAFMEFLNRCKDLTGIFTAVMSLLLVEGWRGCYISHTISTDGRAMS